jgi:YVTN family beta-propeller protein
MTVTPQRWTVPVGQEPVALAVAARSSHLFVTDGAANTVTMLDARTGANLATTTVGQTPMALAVDEAHGRVYTLNACVGALRTPEGSCWGRASVGSILDLNSDTILGSIPGAFGATALALDGRTGRLFVASGAGHTVSVADTRSGQVLRTVELGGEPMALALAVSLQRLTVSVLNPFGGRSWVCLLDSRSGALLRAVPVGRYVGTVLSDARAGRVLVASDGDTYLLDARTGRTLRRIAGGGEPLAVDERAGRALLGGHGHLRLIATRDGAPVGPGSGRGTVEAPPEAAVALDETAGRFYVATEAGLAVLDSHSGRLVRLLALAATPTAVAIDAAAHHLFLLTAGRPGLPGTDRSSPLLRWLQHVLPWLPLPAMPPTEASGTVTELDTTHL